MFNKVRYLVSLITIVMITLIIGCSPKSNYKLLSTMFDGVPDPNKVESTTGVKSSDSLNGQSLSKKNTSVSKVIHPPYKDKGCSNCHEKIDNVPSSKLIKPQLELCYSCHEDFSKKFTWVHGPVAAGSCTKCHSPHASDFKKLLLKEGQALCFTCHDSKDVIKNEVHKEIGQTNCTECHNPHGGSDKTILR